MAELNEAWSVLGNPLRRAAYDSEPQAPAGAASRNVSGVSQGAVRNGPQDRPGTGSVLDFGRYAGWTVGSLAERDPDYLGWLARTPIGRRLAGEIDAALARRDAAAEQLRPKSRETRRSLFGRRTVSTEAR